MALVSSLDLSDRIDALVDAPAPTEGEVLNLTLLLAAQGRSQDSGPTSKFSPL